MMPSDDAPAAAQGASDQQSQGDGSPAQGAAPQGQGPADDQGAASVESLTARIAELERENRDYRGRLKAADQKKAQDVAASQTEAERMAAELTGLRQELAEMKNATRDASTRLAGVTAAQRLGFRDPDLAYRLIDQAEIDFGDDGKPRNIDALLGKIAKDHAYLLTSGDFGGGPRGAPGKGPDMNTLIRQAAGRHT